MGFGGGAGGEFRGLVVVVSMTMFYIQMEISMKFFIISCTNTNKRDHEASARDIEERFTARIDVKSWRSSVPVGGIDSATSSSARQRTSSESISSNDVLSDGCLIYGSARQRKVHVASPDPGPICADIIGH